MKRIFQSSLPGMLLAIIVGCSGDQATGPTYGPAAGAPDDPTVGMDASPGGGAPGGGGPGGPGGGFDPTAIFDRRDENKDGKLTGEELSGRLQDRVEQLDTDGDGEITREEFQEGMQNAFGGGGGGGRRGQRGDNEGSTERVRPELEDDTTDEKDTAAAAQ
jgi:hypothetical protein